MAVVLVAVREKTVTPTVGTGTHASSLLSFSVGFFPLFALLLSLFMLSVICVRVCVRVCVVDH